ncbi:hypothetical protein HPP92_022993 [Vanilla planifolia]|uniref:RING-type E3 ubiquitin transferase n=1 Tax=Vanilla planifolia TaxID=51239 RepID=A0A835UG86_VANPL|nr:hypothetical protein HPP92_023259 [Vanilla planifolia]KAG0459865.1 hypothetical protein HPP92_022993 [Vanilla planifolia]
MSRPAPALLLVLVVAAGAAAQQPISHPPPGIPQGNSLQKSFKPSIVVVIGIFFFMFTVTLVLLMYSRFCNSNPSRFLAFDANNQVGEAAEGRNSGIDKAVIESLPFFRFSALKGSREGLECAVCLSRFEDNEFLRLLPRCKHAFHMACVDLWLNSHSSCPLCRTRVDAEDLAFFKYSASSRCLHRDPSDRPAVPEAVDGPSDGGLELYVEREQVGSPTDASPRASGGWKS